MQAVVRQAQPNDHVCGGFAPDVLWLVDLKDTQAHDGIGDNDHHASENGGCGHGTGELYFATGIFICNGSFVDFHISYVWSIRRWWQWPGIGYLFKGPSYVAPKTIDLVHRATTTSILLHTYPRVMA